MTTKTTNTLPRELRNLQLNPIVDDDEYDEIINPYPGYGPEDAIDYELVEAIDSSAFNCARTWAHINFKAKPRTALNGDGCSSTKLFFGELRYEPKLDTWVVTACCILNGESHGCEFCEVKTIKHPPSGFCMKQTSSGYALRPRARWSGVNCQPY